MQNLGTIQQFLLFGGSTSVCLGPTGFLGRFCFANLVFGIAINFSAIVNPNKQKISEERQP